MDTNGGLALIDMNRFRLGTAFTLGKWILKLPQSKLCLMSNFFDDKEYLMENPAIRRNFALNILNDYLAGDLSVCIPFFQTCQHP